jgi:GNAT superfamily N-acetyltransferase
MAWCGGHADAENAAFHPLRTLVADGTSAAMNFSIRNASAADVAGMHTVRCRVLENRLLDRGRITEASYLPYIRAGSAWVADRHGGIAGFAALDPQSRSVWALFVDAEAEGAGIARALHLRMLEWAKEQGFDSLSLSTEGGTRAELFYRKAGWSEAGFTKAGEILFEIKLRP